MKQLGIIVLAITLNAFANADQAAGGAAAAAEHTAPPAQVQTEKAMGKKMAMGKISKEQRQKCKQEHKGDKKAYMECLKSAQ